VKWISGRLLREVGIAGLHDGSAAFIRRLRDARGEILEALESLVPTEQVPSRRDRVLDDDEIALAASRIRRRSSQAVRDVALFYMLFATGLRPLEIARLRVADYLEADGSVRKHSVLPADASITGRARPLFFASARLTEVMDECLAERPSRAVPDEERFRYRGLLPDAALFVGGDGEGFRITRHGEPGRWRYLCRPILETFRKIFRMAEVDGVTPVSVRRTIVMRLHGRGADEGQIAELLGISDRSCVRQLLDMNRPSLEELAEQLL
jgi:integrase